MNPSYAKTGDWRTMAGVAGLHVMVIAGLLSMDPIAEAVGLSQPLMVSLLATEPEPVPAPLRPPAPVQRIQPIQPRVAPPLLTVPEPAVVAEVPVEPPQPEPMPVVLPTPMAEPAKPVPTAVVAASSAPVSAPSPPPTPFTPPRFDADYLHNPAPAYPPLSRRMGEQGRVVLRVFVNPDGGAGQVEVRESSGYERLDRVARDTVRRWRFVPARQGDKSISEWVLVPLSFSLRS